MNMVRLFLSTLLLSNQENSLSVINWISDEKYTLTGHTSKITGIAKFSRNIIISGSNGEIKIWNIKKRKCMRTHLMSNTATVQSLTKIDRDRIAFYNGSINVYDIRKGTIQFSKEIGNILDIISINEGILGLCGNDDKVRLWYTKDNSITEIVSHNHVICLSRFSDKMYISGGCDGYIKLWNIDDKSSVKTFSMYGWILSLLTIGYK